MANPKFKVPYIDLPSQYEEEKNTLVPLFEKIASSGQFILRQEVQELESKVAEYLGVKHVIGVNSGTDALFLSLKALGIQEGDEVITVSHTFVATISTIVHCGAKPVLVDISNDGNIDASKIESVITSKTKAIVIVHMNGKVCSWSALEPIIKKYNLKVLEDAAQAFGAKYKERFAGSFGDCGAFSLHPMKVFGCMGDGGLITTNSDELYEQLLLLRNHGQKTKSNIVTFGYNSRLDNLQAAFLLHRLENFEITIAKRREIAQVYINELKDLKQIILPLFDEESRRDIFSSFVITSHQRDELRSYLISKGIEVFSHWETPNHKQLALDLDNFSLQNTENYSKEVLSLPLHPYLTHEQVRYVCEKIKEFFNEK